MGFKYHFDHTIVNPYDVDRYYIVRYGCCIEFSSISCVTNTS